MAGYEYNGQVRSSLVKLLLEIEPAQARHAHIQHKACGAIRSLIGQEFPGRGEGFDGEPHRAQQA